MGILYIPGAASFQSTEKKNAYRHKKVVESSQTTEKEWGAKLFAAIKSSPTNLPFSTIQFSMKNTSAGAKLRSWWINVELVVNIGDWPNSMQ